VSWGRFRRVSGQCRPTRKMKASRLPVRRLGQGHRRSDRGPQRSLSSPDTIWCAGWRLLSHMAQTKKNAEIITQVVFHDLSARGREGCVAWPLPSTPARRVSVSIGFSSFRPIFLLRVRSFVKLIPASSLLPQEGGVKVIVKAMAAREGDQAMQVRGCNTIQRMADNDSERTKETITQSGGDPPQHKGRWADLKLLTYSVPLAGLLAILNALKTHGADADAQAKGCVRSETCACCRLHASVSAVARISEHSRLR